MTTGEGINLYTVFRNGLSLKKVGIDLRLKVIRGGAKMPMLHHASYFALVDTHCHQGWREVFMSIVVKEQPIETIFDHRISDSEFSELFYGSPESYDDYVDGLSKDSLLVDIVRLYQLRGKPDLANRYLAKISDESIRFELSTRGCCESHC